MWPLFAARSSAAQCAGALAAAIAFASVQIPQVASAAEPSKPAAGSWRGTYDCGHQLRHMRLEVSGERELTARFCFSRPETSDYCCLGEYELKGTFDPVNDVIEFFPSRWIHEAPGYVMVGLKGLLSKDRQTLSGTIDGPNCGRFFLEAPRRASTPKVLSAGDRAIGLSTLVLLWAAPLTLLVSLILLQTYLLALKRSMLRRAPGAEVEGSPAKVTAPTVTPSSAKLEVSEIEESEAPAPTVIELKQRALRGRWWAAAVYIAAGLAFAVTMATAQLAASGTGFVLSPFLYETLIYAWPTVLTVGLVAAVSWRDWLAIATVYFIVLGVIVKPHIEVPGWEQAVPGFVSLYIPGIIPVLGWMIDKMAGWLGWGIVNIPGSLLALASLAPRIRQVGPMVLLFVIAVVVGWNVEVFMNAEQVDRVGELGCPLGVDVTTALCAMRLGGALLGGVIVWLFLQGLAALYRARQISDQSIIIDSIWLFATIYYAFMASNIKLGWFLAGLAAFLVYKFITLLGFGLLSKKFAAGASDPSLLLLRVFSLGRRSARLFNVFGKLWRYAGSMRLIAGPDLATSTVEPHEFLDFLSGRLSRRFVSGPDALTQQLAQTTPHRDFDGRYRVGDFFCYDDTWKMVLRRLVRESDAVLMDLRGFSPSNKGVIFEIHELLNVVPLNEVVFVIDGTTNDDFLRDVFAEGRASLAADSPNRESTGPVQTFWFTGIGEGSAPGLVSVVTRAAKA